VPYVAPMVVAQLWLRNSSIQRERERKREKEKEKERERERENEDLGAFPR
jgi:hypothetical protein